MWKMRNNIEEIHARMSSHRLKFSMPLTLYAKSYPLCVLHLFIILMSLIMECTGDAVASKTNRQRSDVRELIIELQCYAKCKDQFAKSHFGSDFDLVQIEKSFRSCHEKCKIDTKKSPRPGHCPNVQMSPIPQRLEEFSCVESCSFDFDCADVKKCCSLACDNQSETQQCIAPIGLQQGLEIPPIPKILKYKLPRGHKVEIRFSTIKNITCFYHVETRSHIGLMFSPRKLAAWHWQAVEKITETLDADNKWIDVLFNIKPGRWYQVRVAAINANGFAGYSEPLKAFSLANRPKPPKAPADLKVVSSTIQGDSLNVKIVWCPAKSNLPVEKYKVIWSLYIKYRGDSLISNESFVKNAHQFIIKNLIPDSSYYIQVQAMTSIGKRRLKSEKTSILYNTTTINNSKKILEPYEPLKCTNGHTDNTKFPDKRRPHSNDEITSANLATDNLNLNQSYEVHFLMNRKLGMIVRISGFHPHKEKVYELCPKVTNCEQREYTAIRARKNSLEFSQLKYNTAYVLKAFQRKDEKPTEANRPFIFTTPKCENFNKKFPKMNIQC